MLTSSVMLDLIIGVIVVLSVWLGGKHGLFRTLAELAAYVAAYAASALLSGRVAGMAVEWIRPLAESRLQVIVDEYFSGLRQELPAYLDIGELVEAARNELDIGPLIEQGLYNLSYMLCAVVIFLVVYNRQLEEVSRLEGTGYASHVLMSADGSALVIAGNTAWRYVP